MYILSHRSEAKKWHKEKSMRVCRQTVTSASDVPALHFFSRESSYHLPPPLCFIGYILILLLSSYISSKQLYPPTTLQ